MSTSVVGFCALLASGSAGCCGGGVGTCAAVVGRSCRIVTLHAWSPLKLGSRRRRCHRRHGSGAIPPPPSPPPLPVSTTCDVPLGQRHPHVGCIQTVVPDRQPSVPSGLCGRARGYCKSPLCREGEWVGVAAWQWCGRTGALASSLWNLHGPPGLARQRRRSVHGQAWCRGTVRRGAGGQHWGSQRGGRGSGGGGAAACGVGAPANSVAAELAAQRRWHAACRWPVATRRRLRCRRRRPAGGSYGGYT